MAVSGVTRVGRDTPILGTLPITKQALLFSICLSVNVAGLWVLFHAVGGVIFRTPVTMLALITLITHLMSFSPSLWPVRICYFAPIACITEFVAVVRSFLSFSRCSLGMNSRYSLRERAYRANHCSACPAHYLASPVRKTVKRKRESNCPGAKPR